MLKNCRIFIFSISAAVMAMASFACELFLIAVNQVSGELTPQKLEAELEQNIAQESPTNNGKSFIGSGSGDSPLSFVSMLKAINSRSFSAAA